VTDVAIDTLRIRGPHARRLAAVAAHALPAALDRVLAGVPDVEVSSVHVMLDVNVSEYDDATLATLWADAIRATVLAGMPTQRSAVRPPRSPPISIPAGPAGPGAVLVEARRWLAAPNGAECAVPTALLRLGDPETARAVATALGPHEWSRLLRSLSAVLAPSPHSEVGLQATPGPRPMPDAPAALSASSSVEGAASGPDRPAGPAAPLPPPADDLGRQRATLELLAAFDELMPPESAVIDPATMTRAAGLVLLYPWLPEHCRRAERLHPRLDPLDVREAALATLAAPCDPDLADDLLVGFLAGRAELVSRHHRTRVPLTYEAEVQESAADVLASYVSLLPGFENSSAQFIRENWIARLGTLDPGREPALLTAASHPLDVVLPRLPYPVGLFKLPWSPPLSVRFRP
jgi:hypothetical protein